MVLEKDAISIGTQALLKISPPTALANRSSLYAIKLCLSETVHGSPGAHAGADLLQTLSTRPAPAEGCTGTRRGFIVTGELADAENGIA